MVWEKVLVIGGAGYIGGLTVDLLLENHYDVYVYDSLLYEERYLKPVNFIYGDIRDHQKIYELHQKHKFDAIVVLAAIVGDPACNVNPNLTEQVNYQAITDLCNFMPDDTHFVFMSTCSVYGANDDVVTETSNTKPLSCYASTKLRAEKPMLYKGATVFRLGTVYGTGDHYSRIRADLVVNTLTVKAFIENEITVNGGGQYRPIIAARDVAEYVVEACRRKQEAAGLYNLGFRNVQIVELAEDIIKVFPNVKVNKIDAMFQDERNYKVSTEKADSVFKFRPKTLVVEEVEKLHNLLKSHRITNPLNVNYNNGLFLAQRRI